MKAIEALREAVQEYVRAEAERPGLIVTDFVVCASGVDMATADSEITYGTAHPGPRHSALGLVQILEFSLMEGDDD